jgi:hypothetical protein
MEPRAPGWWLSWNTTLRFMRSLKGAQRIMRLTVTRRMQFFRSADAAPDW